MTVEGFMQQNDSKKQFNFFKSLGIANINSKVENLHQGTHEFWELKEFSRNKKAYNKQTVQEVGATMKEICEGIIKN